MKNLSLIIVLFITLFVNNAQAQDSTRVREYKLGIYNQYDLRTSSTNGITVQRMLTDVYRKGLKSKMNSKLYNVTNSIYSFATTYLTMLWSHEFGHSLRAKQVGGHFKIHNVGLPFPYTTMHLPQDITLVDETLSVTGGFEVNYLNVRSIQQEFVLKNGLPNEDIAFAFANRLMYPLYTSLIVPIDAEDKQVWIRTAGDPVHVTLPVFKNFSNNKVFMPDSTVNPELVDYYNQANMFASLFNLLDPQFYRELGGSFGKDKSRKPVFLIGDHNNGWTYGTLFNVSPLGYELYMNNYLHINGNKFSGYFKYGRPFQNLGIGINWHEIKLSENANISAGVEVWDQDLFGKGIAAEIIAVAKLSEYFGASATIGYKTEGYVLGKQVSKGFTLGVNLIYYTKY